MWGLFLKIPMRLLRHRIVPKKALDLGLVLLTGLPFDLAQFDPSGDPWIMGMDSMVAFSAERYLSGYRLSSIWGPAIFPVELRQHKSVVGRAVEQLSVFSTQWW